MPVMLTAQNETVRLLINVLTVLKSSDDAKVDNTTLAVYHSVTEELISERLQSLANNGVVFSRETVIKQITSVLSQRHRLGYIKPVDLFDTNLVLKQVVDQTPPKREDFPATYDNVAFTPDDIVALLKNIEYPEDRYSHTRD